MPSRLKSDNCDRSKIRIKLEQCINPLEPTQHPANLVNVSTGYINKCNAVNVEQAIDIGRQQMQTFVEKFPDSFHKTISKQVHMLKSEKKGIHFGHTQVFNTEAIYARIMCLISLGQTTLQTELSPVPTSLFQDSGDMRFAKTKSVLKANLEVQYLVVLTLVKVQLL